MQSRISIRGIAVSAITFAAFIGGGVNAVTVESTAWETTVNHSATERAVVEPQVPTQVAATQAAPAHGVKAHRAHLAQLARTVARVARRSDQPASRGAQRGVSVSGDPRTIARSLAASHYGWGAGEFSCLDALWTRESGWNSRAENASSGAYGIPQALPGSKMASEGADWRTNPVTQIAWGLSYIDASYGTPCSAEAHSQASGWY